MLRKDCCAQLRDAAEPGGAEVAAAPAAQRRSCCGSGCCGSVQDSSMADALPPQLRRQRLHLRLPRMIHRIDSEQPRRQASPHARPVPPHPPAATDWPAKVESANDFRPGLLCRHVWPACLTGVFDRRAQRVALPPSQLS